MSYRPKILAFAGSLRKDSYNKKLVKIALQGAQQAGAEVTYIDLEDYPLPVYSAEIEAQGIPENVIKLKNLMYGSDGFLISSPEYNSSISGPLKNVIDWVSRPASPDEVYLSSFIDKIAMIISASPGALGGLRGLVTLRSILENIYTYVIPTQKSLPNAAEAFDEQGNLKNAKDQKAFIDLGRKLVEVTSKMKS